MTTQMVILIFLTGGMLLLISAATHFSGNGNLDNIKSKTVGDGQHGTARWATKKEIGQAYAFVPFTPAAWRKGENLPKKQGLVLGCQGPKNPTRCRSAPSGPWSTPASRSWRKRSSAAITRNTLKSNRPRQLQRLIPPTDGWHTRRTGRPGKRRPKVPASARAQTRRDDSLWDISILSITRTCPIGLVPCICT